MGCVCCSLSSFVSIVLNALERISLCTVCALLVCCLLLTIITILIMGIGIGFQYCTVQSNVAAMERAAEAAGAVRSGDVSTNPKKPAAVASGRSSKRLTSLQKLIKGGFASRSKRDMLDDMPSNNITVTTNDTATDWTKVVANVTKFNY